MDEILIGVAKLVKFESCGFAAAPVSREQIELLHTLVIVVHGAQHVGC